MYFLILDFFKKITLFLSSLIIVNRLKQVLSHLLSNSIKFTDKGKVVVTISVQLQNVIDEDKDKPAYGQTTKKGNLLIELYDTGIG
ncbi:708_t:CDS:2, partial [Racocetra persica]